MSKLARLRKKVNYETDIPRCETCTHYRARRIYLYDSLPRVAQTICAKHSFWVRANAVCDTWAGKDGSALADAAIDAAIAKEKQA